MRRRILGLAILCCALPVAARNLGTIGPVYPIAEPHLLEQIARKLKAAESDGTIARLEREAIARAERSVLDPEPVPGITKAAMPRVFRVDPSFVLERDVVDHRGQVLFAAGTRRNPLDVVSLSKHLLFFDARDAAQVASARRLIDRHEGRVKPILVAGSYIDLMRRWGEQVYYDQHGVLSRRLGIRAVPALVSQEGHQLRVEELPSP